jgi:hypothetical protein
MGNGDARNGPADVPPSAIPADLRRAVDGGWWGAALVATEPDGAPALVCSGPPGAGAGAALRLVETAADPRTIAIAIEPPLPGRRGPRAARALLDLAYAEVRALVGRVADADALSVLWAAPGRAPILEPLPLTGPLRLRLRLAAARAGEWHAEDPWPPAICRGCWHEARRDAPCLVSSALPTGEVLLVVPVEAAPGTASEGQLLLSAGILAPPGHGGAADLELTLRWDAAGGSEIRIGLDLAGPDERALVARLSRQRRMLVLGAGGDGEDDPRCALRVALGEEARRLLAAATVAASERARRSPTQEAT